MRTLVISDLHLGAPGGRDLLRSRPAVREPLIDVLAAVERLVLLGDVVELRHGRVADALSAAEPVLATLAAALPDTAEIVVVPGNHDHHLLDAWLARRDDPASLGLENAVDFSDGEPLAELIGALGGRSVRVCYPGVWLREDVYAHHGHFGDRHTTVPMIERLAVGAVARVLREDGDGPRSVADYERSLAPVYAFIHAVAQAGGPASGASAGAWLALAGETEGGSAGDGGSQAAAGAAAARARRAALRTGFGGGVALLNRLGLGPLRADLSGSALRRAGLGAAAEVAHRLSISAEHVVFGHTHRAGRLPADAAAEWSRDGRRFWNTGCWVDEGPLLGAEPGRSPYRPGFALELGPDGPPQLVNLLD